MKKPLRIFPQLFPLLFLLLLPFWSAAQGSQTLKGYVQEDGDGPRPYEITFTQSGTRISGHSLTNTGGYTSLGARISGTLIGDHLTLEEFPLPGQTEDGITTYCYFKGDLRRQERNGRIVFSGPYTSHGIRQNTCLGGLMVLVLNPDRPKPQPTPAPVAAPPAPVRITPPPSRPVATTPPVQRPQPAPQPRPLAPKPDTTRPQIPVTVPAPAPAPVRIDTVAVQPPPRQLPMVPDTAHYDNLYLWKSDTVGIVVWDGYKEDGDVVSLLIDGQPVFQNRRLEKIPGPVMASVLLSDGRTHKLTLLLHGEGAEPPNTPSILLLDGGLRKELAISGKDGQEAVLYFRKQR